VRRAAESARPTLRGHVHAMWAESPHTAVGVFIWLLYNSKNVLKMHSSLVEVVHQRENQIDYLKREMPNIHLK
jgi:hypothetical protein